MPALVFLRFAWPYLLALVIAGGAGWKGWNLGAAHVQAAWDAERVQIERAAQAAKDAAIAKERANTARAMGAMRDAKRKEAEQRAAADVARTESERLRDALAAARRGLPEACRDAGGLRLDGALEVLGECGERYQRMAEAADAATRDAQTLMQAWPK